MQLELHIKPRSLEDGILLYNAQNDNGIGDFIGIMLRDGHVEFRYDTGSGQWLCVYYMYINS
jgi:hypothetical protein